MADRRRRSPEASQRGNTRNDHRYSSSRYDEPPSSSYQQPQQPQQYGPPPTQYYPPPPNQYSNSYAGPPQQYNQYAPPPPIPIMNQQGGRTQSPVSYSSSSSSSSSSLLDISRSYPPKAFGIRTFFTAPSEHRRLRKRRSRKLFKFNNSSSSSVNSDLAYGNGYLKKKKLKRSRSRKGKEVIRDTQRERERYKEHTQTNTYSETKISGGEGNASGSKAGKTEAEILAIGAGLAKIARDQNKRDLRNSSRTDLGSGGPQFSGSRGLAPSKVSHGPDEDGWESASDDESDSSVDSTLAFGNESTVGFWSWGKKKHTPVSRKSTLVDPRLFGRQNSLHGIITEPVGFNSNVTWTSTTDFGPQNFTPGEPNAPTSYPGSINVSQTSLQQVFPVATSDPHNIETVRKGGSMGSGTEIYTPSSRPEPVPIQHPKPFTPVSQSVYEPTYATRSNSRAVVVDKESSGRGGSLAGAALAGLAGAVAVAAVTRKDDRDEKRGEEARRDEDRARRREEDRREEELRQRREDERRHEGLLRRRDEERREVERLKRLEEERQEKERSKKRDKESRRDSPERKSKDKDKDKKKGSSRGSVIGDDRRDSKSDKKREETREEKEKRREKRREEKQSAREDDYYDSRRTRSESSVQQVAVDPFQYQIQDGADPNHTTISAPVRRNGGTTPTVVTVEREPDFSRKRSSSIKEIPSYASAAETSGYSTKGDRNGYYEDREPRDLPLQSAEKIYHGIQDSTAPLSTAAIAAGAFAVAAEGHRESRSDKRRKERSGDSRDYNDRSYTAYDREERGREASKEKERDLVQEEADRAYRELVMARKIASQVIRSRTPSPDRSVVHKYDHKDEDEIIRIETPPEMKEHQRGKGPYDAPNADFKPDYVLRDPRELHSFSIVPYTYDRSTPESAFLKRDPDADRPRPHLNLVHPTPIPSPLPEKQESRSQDKEKPKAKDRDTDQQNATADVVIGPRGNVVSQSPTSSNISKGVKWGQNETKHYEVESPQEHREEFVTKDDVKGDQSKSQSASSRGWGTIAAGVGATAGVISASRSNERSQSPTTRENERRDSVPYEYRGVIVEPEPISKDDRQPSPPSPGPKPTSRSPPRGFSQSSDQPRSQQPAPSYTQPEPFTQPSQKASRSSQAPLPSSSRIPGAFDDDLDFTAHVAAGLQDTGFDPNIVINDPAFRRRDSPPGSKEPIQPSLYRTPFAETVTDLGIAPSGSQGEHGFVIGEVNQTPTDWRSGAPDGDDSYSQLSRKEQKKRDKEAKRRSVDVPALEETSTRELVEEPESYFEPTKLSKKEQRRRDKEAQRERTYTDDVPPLVDTISVAPQILDNSEGYFETPKKSKKKSKKGSGYDDEVETPQSVTVPVDAFNDVQADDAWDEPKKSKKKSKRDSERYDSPPQSGLSSEVGADLERSSSKKSKDKSRRHAEMYQPNPSEISLPPSTPSETSQADYYDSRSSRKSTRDSGVFDGADRDDSRSVVSTARTEDGEHRRKKKSRSSTKDDFDDTRSVASAPAGDDDDRKKKREKKSGSGFFGLFGSKSDVGPRDESPKRAKDDAEESRKRSKKEKRRSMPDSSSLYGDLGSSSVNDLSRSNGHSPGYDDDDPGARSDGERRKTRSRAESTASKKDSFLDNAGTLGAGVGIAGVAAALVAQHHQQSKASHSESLEGSKPVRSKSPENAPRYNQDEILDPEIVQRQIRPSIDPQYGDLLPLPPSNPGTPHSEILDEFPELPDSRPGTPEVERTTRPSNSTLRRSFNDGPMKSPSQSAVPLSFRLGNRSIPSSPAAVRSPTTQAFDPASQDNLVQPRTRPSRPTSWEHTKEYKPLYLVESTRRSQNVRSDEPEIALPELPPSQSTSRSSSQHEFEDRKNLDIIYAPLTLESQPNGPLSIDVGLASAHVSNDILGSQQSTPKAGIPRDFGDFDTSALKSSEDQELPIQQADDVMPPTAEDKPHSLEDTAHKAAVGAGVISSIGYLASSPNQSLPKSDWMDDSHSIQRRPSPIDPMSKDRSSYLLNSSPASKIYDDDEPALRDVSSPLSTRIKDSESLKSIDEIAPSDNLDQSLTLPALPSSQAEPISTPALDTDTVDFNPVFQSKKDKKRDKKKSKSQSRSSTQDEFPIPDPSTTATIRDDSTHVDPPTTELERSNSKKDKKGKNKKRNILEWEEPTIASTTEASVLPYSQMPETREIIPVEEIEEFSAPKSKKDRKKEKKKRGSLLAWDEGSSKPESIEPPQPEPSLSVPNLEGNEPPQEATRTPTAQSDDFLEPTISDLNADELTADEFHDAPDGMVTPSEVDVDVFSTPEATQEREHRSFDWRENQDRSAAPLQPVFGPILERQIAPAALEATGETPEPTPFFTPVIGDAGDVFFAPKVQDKEEILEAVKPELSVSTGVGDAAPKSVHKILSEETRSVSPPIDLHVEKSITAVEYPDSSIGSTTRLDSVISDSARSAATLLQAKEIAQPSLDCADEPKQDVSGLDESVSHSSETGEPGGGPSARATELEPEVMFSTKKSRKDKKAKKNKFIDFEDTEPIPPPLEVAADESPVKNPPVSTDVVPEIETSTKKSKKEKKGKKSKVSSTWEPEEEFNEQAQTGDVGIQEPAVDPSQESILPDAAEFSIPSVQVDTVDEDALHHERGKKFRDAISEDTADTQTQREASETFTSEPLSEAFESQILSDAAEQPKVTTDAFPMDDFATPKPKKDKKGKKSRNSVTWDDPIESSQPQTPDEWAPDTTEPSSERSSLQKDVESEQTTAGEDFALPKSKKKSKKSRNSVSWEDDVALSLPQTLDEPQPGITQEILSPKSLPETEIPQDIEEFALPKFKKEKKKSKKGKASTAWDDVEQVLLPSDTEVSAPVSDDIAIDQPLIKAEPSASVDTFNEFALPKSKEEKKSKKGKSTLSTEIVPEFPTLPAEDEHVPSLDPGDDTAAKAPESSIPPDDIEDFSLPKSKKDRKKDEQKSKSTVSSEPDSLETPLEPTPPKPSWSVVPESEASDTLQSSVVHSSQPLTEPKLSSTPSALDQESPPQISADRSIPMDQETPLQDDNFPIKSKKDKKKDKKKSKVLAWEDEPTQEPQPETSQNIGEDVPTPEIDDFTKPSSKKEKKSKKKSASLEASSEPVELLSSEVQDRQFERPQDGPKDLPPSDDFSFPETKKSKKKKKNRLSSVQATGDGDQALSDSVDETILAKPASDFGHEQMSVPQDVNEPAQSVEIRGGFEAGYNNDQLSLARQLQEEFSAGNKKSKKDKKKRQSLPITPDLEDSRSRAIEEQSPDQPRARSLSIGPVASRFAESPSSDLPRSVYNEDQLELAKQLKAEFGIGSDKKSKKDKKKRSGIPRSTTFDDEFGQPSEETSDFVTPLEEAPTISEDAQLKDGFDAGYQEDQLSLARQLQAEFDNKKSKKDKKKRSGLSRSTTQDGFGALSEDPADFVTPSEEPQSTNAEDEPTRDGFDAGYQEDQLSLARQLQAEFGKKSKKDKKRRSTSQTPLQHEPRTDYFGDVSQSLLPSTATDDLVPDVSLGAESTPAREGLAVGYNEDQLELARQLKEEFGSKKSKKEKRSKKRDLLQPTTDDGFGSWEQSNAESPFVEPSADFESATPNLEDEFTSSSKKSKKDKKGKKRDSPLATPVNEPALIDTPSESFGESQTKDVSQPEALETSRDATPMELVDEWALPGKKSKEKKSKKRGSVVPEIIEEAPIALTEQEQPADDNPPSQDFGDASVPAQELKSVPDEEGTVNPEEEFFTSSQRSKKDKKSKKRDSLAQSTSDVPTPSEDVAIETPPAKVDEPMDIDPPATLETPGDDPVPLFTTKKSKKDKKKRQSLGFLDREPEPEAPSSEFASNEESNVDTAGNSTAEAGSEDFGFSSKKANKDKKKSLLRSLSAVDDNESRIQSEDQSLPQTIEASKLPVESTPTEPADEFELPIKKSKKDKKTRKNLQKDIADAQTLEAASESSPLESSVLEIPQEEKTTLTEPFAPIFIDEAAVFQPGLPESSKSEPEVHLDDSPLSAKKSESDERDKAPDDDSAYPTPGDPVALHDQAAQPSREIDTIQEKTIVLDDRQEKALDELPAVVQEDDWTSSIPIKKSKKDKKRKSSGFSTPIDEELKSGLAVAEIEFGSFKDGTQIAAPEETVPEPDDAWIVGSSKKSKKDKKRQSGLSTPPEVIQEPEVEKASDFPQEALDATTSVGASQLPQDNWDSFPSKKSKKDKKKSKTSGISTPIEDPEHATDVNRETSIQDTLVAEGPVEPVDEDWTSSFSTKKTKKDKRKSKSSMSIPLEENEPNPSTPVQESTVVRSLEASTPLSESIQPDPSSTHVKDMTIEPLIDSDKDVRAPPPTSDATLSAGNAGKLETPSSVIDREATSLTSGPIQAKDVETIEKSATDNSDVILTHLTPEAPIAAVSEPESSELVNSTRDLPSNKVQGSFSEPTDERTVDKIELSTTSKKTSSPPIEDTPRSLDDIQPDLVQTNPVDNAIEDNTESASWGLIKKSKKDKKKRKSAVSTPIDDMSDPFEPFADLTREAATGLPDVSSNVQEDPWELPSKSSKKDKKKKKSGLSTPVDDILPPIEPEKQIEESSPAVEGLGTTDQPAPSEPEAIIDEWNISRKLSKKDKKKKKSGLSTPTEEFVDSVESREIPDVVSAIIPQDLDTTADVSGPADEDWSSFSTKPRKKDKKKKLKAIASNLPEESTVKVEQISDRQISGTQSGEQSIVDSAHPLSTETEPDLLPHVQQRDSESLPQLTDKDLVKVATVPVSSDNKPLGRPIPITSDSADSFMKLPNPTDFQAIPQEQPQPEHVVTPTVIADVSDNFMVPANPPGQPVAKPEELVRPSGIADTSDSFMKGQNPLDFQTLPQESPKLEPAVTPPGIADASDAFMASPNPLDYETSTLDKDVSAPELDEWASTRKKSKKDKKAKRTSRVESETGQSLSEAGITPGPETASVPLLDQSTTVEEKSILVAEPESTLSLPEISKPQPADNEGSVTISKKLSKKDKRKRKTTLDLSSTEDSSTNPLTSWADEVEEAEIERNAPVIEDIDKDESLARIASTTEAAPFDEFVRPTKKGKKGKRKSEEVSSPQEKVEVEKSVTKEDSRQDSSNVFPAAASIAAGAAAVALIGSGEKSKDEGKKSKDTPSRKVSKKDKKKKEIDRRTPREDIFDDPELWGGKDAKVHEETREAGGLDDDGGSDGFWSPPQQDHEEMEWTEELDDTAKSRAVNQGEALLTPAPEDLPQPSEERDLEISDKELTIEVAVPDEKGESHKFEITAPLVGKEEESGGMSSERGEMHLPEAYRSPPKTPLTALDRSLPTKDFAETPTLTRDAFSTPTQVERLITEEAQQERSPFRPQSSNSKFALTGFSDLPAVVEEFTEDDHYLKSSPDRKQSPNRDSAFVSGSPIPGHRSLASIHEPIRDSGVHLRDDSPSNQRSRGVSTSDDAIARLSWPSVDEEHETVDLHKSQRLSSGSSKHSPDRSKQTTSITHTRDVPSSQASRSPGPIDLFPASGTSHFHSKTPEPRSDVERRKDLDPPQRTRDNRPIDLFPSLKHDTWSPDPVKQQNREVTRREHLPSQQHKDENTSADLHRTKTIQGKDAKRPSEGNLIRQRLQLFEGGSDRPEKPKTDKYGELGSQKPKAEQSRGFSDTALAGAAIAAGTIGFAAARQSSAERRPDSAQSQRSVSNINRLRTPDPKLMRPDSALSNRSGTPPLRRTDRKLSGDLRSLSQRSKPDLAKEAELAAAATTIVNTANPTANEGRARAKDMADVYDGFGEGRMGSPRSPTRPHSMRRRQSMQVLELESKLEQLAAENRSLADAHAQAERSLQQSKHVSSSVVEKDAEIDALKRTLEWMQKEVTRLTEVNEGLQSAHVTLGSQHSQQFGTLERQHGETTRELEELRHSHTLLASSVVGMVAGSVVQDKDREIAKLRAELDTAKEKIREMQRQILAAKADEGSEFLVFRDEDYFDNACQQLCQHVQQWVLRFSKFSDMRACRLTSEINHDKTIDRLDNAILDGSDVDSFLSDRIKRRDVFMSMTMTMIWEFIFTRYLFGMDREQRQKLKTLEKLLQEVGPAAAVHQWRATTLTLLSRRSAFVQQREQDTLAVVHAILETLSEILPPPSHLEGQIEEQLNRVIKSAVDLSIEMRTQRAEYMMLPPLQPEYDANGDLASKVSFNAALMNERSGDTVSNEELEEQSAVVRIVLFPLVVKKGDDKGEGDDEIVVCPAQVLVAAEKKAKKVRVLGPGSVVGGNSSRLSMQSGMPMEEGSAI